VPAKTARSSLWGLCGGKLNGIPAIYRRYSSRLRAADRRFPVCVSYRSAGNKWQHGRERGSNIQSADSLSPGGTVPSSTLFQILADIVLLMHLAFILFVVLGGFLALRWRGLVWLHLPALAWGILVESMGWICPLTPLENQFRLMAGGQDMGRDFLGHYLASLIYPPHLTRGDQLWLAAVLVLLNLVAYGIRLRQHVRRR